jgi:hypothetical protein
MRTAVKQFGNNSGDLSAQVADVRAKTEAVLASFQAIRQGSAQLRRASAALRDECREARLQCRLMAERHSSRKRSSISTNPSNDPQPRQIAHALARLLSEMGVPAFVLQPFQDTAIRQ